MKAGSSVIRRMSTHGRLADIVLVNGKITIGDVDATECEALAIHDDRILAVGANDEMQALAHDKTIVVDLS
ncbi:MAG: amidohydrolase, partial [Chloroflexi bacterium]|nr:amidohydrolase [Chloroflexota bacterium]